MYSLPPHQLHSLCTPIRASLQGLWDGHTLVLTLQHRLGGPLRDGQFPRPPNAPRLFRRSTRRFCSGKRRHRQRPPNTSVTDSVLRSLGYPSPISFASFAIYAFRRYTWRATPSPRMPSSVVWTAKGHGTLLDRFMRSVVSISCTVIVI
jgi:hypothetical protein